MLIGKEKLKCYAGIFKRLRYFDGLMLKKEDFEAEQYYFHEKARLHNRLHGDGVVWGLQLTLKNIPIEGQDDIAKLHIEPGFALDCAGNEILVRESHRVDVEGKLRTLQHPGETVDAVPTLWIGIAYCEYKSNPEPQHHILPDDGNPQPSQCSRVREGYQVWICTEDELSECCKAKAAHYASPEFHEGADCLGMWKCCSEDCPIILGRVRDYQDAATLSIDSTFHPLMVQNTWEKQKQRMLHIACKELDWVDLSAVINQTAEVAEKWIVDNGLEEGKRLEIAALEAEPNLMVRIGKAISCVKKNSKIDLIIDPHGYVLFALPQEGGT